MARRRKSEDNINQPQFKGFLKPYRSQGLFADHFLKGRLLEFPEWREVAGTVDAFEAILELYSERTPKFTKRTNEAQTERDFIQPVLDILWHQAEGDCYQVQVRIPNLDASRQPDYAFFHNARERNNAEERLGTIDYWRDVPALGDAKKWSASLDKQRGVDDNPSAQICNYLYRSRVRWGILTNGHTWRLYERERSSVGGVFYEVNLADILRHHDIEAFKYFYFFFRREAFVPDQDGTTFIEKVFQDSVDYAAKVGDQLKESVYDALRVLMNGFLEYPDNELDRHDPETLKLVHENCLIILYRLLFLLYAEDRLLLPRSDEPYASYSLYHLQQEINQHLRSGEAYLPMGRRFWGDLTSLFSLIDGGSPDAGIPAYNGGLFSPSNHPHVAHTSQPNTKRWEIGDHYLAEAIDLLAYERDSWDKVGERHVDYSTLDVQHLGSIYEGLLELHPSIAEEPLIETSKSGKSSFKPESDVPNPRPIRGQPPRRINKDAVYLATDRGERKATGSYYTPKYIVQYIVENTVGVLAEEAEKQVAVMRPEVDREIRKLERKKREWEKSSASDAEEHIAGFTKFIEEQKRRLLEPYLSLKILDPAMGSGHFLVGAADFLSLAMATDPKLLPLKEMDEDPQAFCKRLVVERCLYGVDLNPLAVELAKLSLWLHTVSKDKALSFLDHHLRCGNSLVGARIEDDLSQIPPELNARGRVKKIDTTQPILGFTEALIAKHLQYFLDTFRKIMETPTGDAETERMKDKWYREMDTVRDRFRSVANCWLAPYFGVPVTLSQCQRAVKALRDSDAEWQALQKEKWFQDVQSVAHQKRFFHWELEFPEMFFDAHGFRQKRERGFDTVIGNPPYVSSRNENFYDEARSYIGATFKQAFYQVDLYYLFIEYVHTLAKSYWSLIVPDPWLASVKTRDFRKWLSVSNQVLRFAHGRSIFEADVDCIVIVCGKAAGTSETSTVVDKFAPSGSVIASHMVEIPTDGSEIVILGNERTVELLRKIISKSVSLDSIATTGRGIGAYHHSKHSQEIIKSRAYHSKRKKDETFLPELLGQHIHPHEIAWSGDNWISYGEWLSEPRDPVFFIGSRILCRKIIGERLSCTLANENWLANQQIYIACVFDKGYQAAYAATIISSRLMGFFSRKHYHEEGLFPHLRVEQFRQLPIRHIAFTTLSDDRALLVEEGKQLYEHCLSQKDNDSVMDFIEYQFSQTPERADVVHDLLAFLAERMIEMNKQKQTEIKGFRRWLERHIGATVDDLKNKTKLRAYHEHNFETLLDVLRQNRRKLEVNADARDVQEAIEGEFNKSMAKLTPLKAKIAATDRLIDLIVYRLYGLTEEEIAVVEEA